MKHRVGSRSSKDAASNLIEATSDMGAFVLFSAVLKRVAVKLSKICNDLRLLSSGPRAGFAGIRLPSVQAGSSIMPGKVNPVIPEVVNQVAYMVIGHDLTVTMCAEGGQLQLNAFEPTIGYCVAPDPDGRGQQPDKKMCGGHRGRSGAMRAPWRIASDW
jgi:aspartate ammonia-lyase